MDELQKEDSGTNQTEALGVQSDVPMREMTLGEKLVGLTFNPSGDPKVNKAKELCAELADLLWQDGMKQEQTDLSQRLFNHTIGEILNAKMNVVKVLTLNC